MLITIVANRHRSSFLAGSLPLSFGLSQNHSRIISAIGTGLLVGTCLIIIIPEGIETLYSSSAHSLHSEPIKEIPKTGAGQADLLDDPSRMDAPSRLMRRLAEETHASYEPHAWIGISLISGFILMYLIDQLPRLAANSAPRKPMHISLAALSQGPHRVSSSGLSVEDESLDELDPVSYTHLTLPTKRIV